MACLYAVAEENATRKSLANQYIPVYMYIHQRLLSVGFQGLMGSMLLRPHLRITQFCNERILSILLICNFHEFRLNLGHVGAAVGSFWAVPLVSFLLGFVTFNQ